MFLIKRSNTLKLTITALLTAIAIVIPMVMPVRIVIGPASFTLASHVPIFLAMFFSPGIAVTVSIGSAIGFLLASFPIVIVLRALSHVVFAFIGAKILMNHREEILSSPKKSTLFSLGIGVVHGAAEMLIVSLFFYGVIPGTSYTEGFFYVVFTLVGMGTIIHSMVDFLIAQFIWKSMGSRLINLDRKMVK